MAEYIEREKAIDALTERNLVVHMDSVNDGLVASCHRSAQRVIANLPAVDVQEVIFCGKCKFWDRERISCEGLARCNTGESGIRYRNRNDFCSRGKKREES